MTLYLQVSVGPAQYLIVATQVTQLGPAENDAASAATVIDCRELFGAPAEAPGYRLNLAPEDDDAPLALVVDRVDGLVERDEGTFRALPPIGRFGTVIDAVAVPVGAESPALRLHIRSALLAGALFPRGERDAGSGAFADC